MKKSCFIVATAALLIMASWLMAQDKPEAGASPAGEEETASLESRAQQEAKSMEKELVRMVRKLLSKDSKPKKNSGEPKQKEEISKAAVPEPQKQDARKLREQLDEWKSKSLEMVDIMKLLKLADLKEDQDQKKKKLIEKIKRHEKVVINPKHGRPNGEEAERLGRAVEKEMNKLEREYDKEQNRIERESEREEELIRKLARELEKAVLPQEEKKTKKNTPQRLKPRREQKREKSKPDRKGAPGNRSG